MHSWTLFVFRLFCLTAVNAIPFSAEVDQELSIPADSTDNWSVDLLNNPQFGTFPSDLIALSPPVENLASSSDNSINAALAGDPNGLASTSDGSGNAGTVIAKDCPPGSQIGISSKKRTDFYFVGLD